MESIINRIKKIPDSDKKEFIEEQVSLIKRRIQLLCYLSIAIYALSTILSFILLPKDFKSQEIPFWFFLIGSCLLVIYFSKKAKTINSVKMYAYLFTALLLTFIVIICIIYSEWLVISSSVFLFIIFLISFTIPWLGVETIPVTLLHICAYTFLYSYTQNFLPERISAAFNLRTYIDGVLVLTMAFIMCFVIRRKETFRDVQNFVLRKELEKKNEQMHKELDLATRVHKTLIPKSVSTNLVDVAVMYLPMYYIGGDYAKFHFIDQNKLIFIICDVTGHGVPAALLVNRIHSEFERLAAEAKQPGPLLKELNDFIVKVFEGTDMYLSAFCCMLDFDEMKLTYSNHGHPAQYIYRATKSDIEKLDPHAGLLGLPFMDYGIEQHEIHFSRGDKLLLFTDGVPETKNKEGQEFGQERLENFVRGNYELAATPFNQRLLEELNNFKYGKFADDIFIVTIGVKD